MKPKHIEIAFFLAFLLTIAFSTASFEKDCKEVRNSILRLHVIANSDTEEDQALKLKVRDAVLEKSKSLFKKSDSKASAKSQAQKSIDILTEAAKNVISENGYDYNVQIEVGKSNFPTKTYEAVTLPAGEYDAVRVLIGKAEGKNWWCVMFPPLCLPAAKGDKKIDDVLGEDALRLVTSNPKYEIRFWIVEKMEKMREKVREN